MSDHVLIFWTTGSIEEARRVSRFLVQEQIVACANIIPWVESIYLWEGKLETQQETKVVFKTRASLYDKVKQVIYDNTQYEVPEITQILIDKGNEDYLKWMDSTLAVKV